MVQMENNRKDRKKKKRERKQGREDLQTQDACSCSWLIVVLFFFSAGGEIKPLESGEVLRLLLSLRSHVRDLFALNICK